MLPVVVVPNYEITLPLTKKKISIRPFLVKEEKLFLIASESGDRKEIFNAIKQVVTNCIVSPKGFNIDTITMTDLEYVFIQLRSKSMGEKVELKFVCNAPADNEEKVCGKTSDYVIELDDIKLSRVPPDTKIKISGSTGIVMRFPDLKLAEQLIGASTGIEEQINTLIAAIDYVYDGEKLFYPKDEPVNVWIDWLDTLPPNIIEQMKEFLDDIPSVAYDLKFKCVCGHEETVKLEGIDAFFG